MTEIRKFSLLYDAGEDRIAWDAEDLEGATTRLWLTQRLCRGLVGALLPMLRDAVAGTAAPEHESTVQSWEQAAAMAGFGRTPGVTLAPGTVVGLVQAAHIRPGPAGLALSLDFVPAGSRSVILSPAAVRQMLTVMRRLCQAAGWPMDIWPGWMADPGGAAAADALN